MVSGEVVTPQMVIGAIELHESEDRGATRDEVVVHLARETDASAEEISTAIHHALMDGLCYQPDGESFRAIQ